MHSHSSYDATLVMLSFVVSAFGAFTALKLAVAIPTADEKSLWGWLSGASIALGGGAIWAMHFIAMLAYQMPMRVTYDVSLTFLSLVIAVVVTGTGLYIVGRGAPSLPRLLGAGLFTGLGVCAMHYIGMAAMQMQATIHYDPLLVMASVLIAVVASAAALWLAFNMRGTWQTVGSCVVMAVAVSGMHYTGMAAAEMRPAPGLPASTSMSIQADGLGMTVTAIIFFLLVVLLLVGEMRDRALAVADE
jgi:NO-binding membrane sensor protein with MHYT domain